MMNKKNLTRIDIRPLQLQIIKNTKTGIYKGIIHNKKYKDHLPEVEGSNPEEIKEALKYQLYKFLLNKNMIRHCTKCNTIIFSMSKKQKQCKDCDK